MSTSVGKNERLASREGTESSCDATCSCNARGLSTKAKTGICLLVALVAVVVVLLGSANKARTATQTDPFTISSAAVSPMPTPAAEKPAAPTAPKQAPTAVWGPTLSSLASLNDVAADKDAVFVFVPAKDGKQTATIRAQVKAAATKAQSRGASITAYMLSSDAEEYAQIIQQVSPPCVLAMVKGAGAIPVSGEITEAKLLEALVTASRPSSCGPSGCGPTGCG